MPSTGRWSKQSRPAIPTAPTRPITVMHGLLPGPRLFEQNPQVIDSIYVASFIASIAQIGLGILILPACVWLVNRPRPYRAGFIFALILSGIYTLNNSLFDLGLALALGLVGYLMRLARFPFLPMILGVVLGHMSLATSAEPRPLTEPSTAKLLLP